MKELSKVRPLAEMRKGYRGSGYSFHFVRLSTKKSLRAYAEAIRNGVPEGWFDTGELPVSLTVCTVETVLPGIIPESAPTHDGASLLCDVYIMVVQNSDPAVERRHWYHEVGHAVDFAKKFYPAIFQAGPSPDVSEARYGLYCTEFSGYCNEYVCGLLDAFLSGDTEPVKSGFPFLFPWLNDGGDL